MPTCAEAGILGVVTGIMGTMGAAEAIKLVAGVGDPMVGRLLLVDILRMRFEEIRYRRPPIHRREVLPLRNTSVS